MAWIEPGDRSLSQSEMDNNAWECYYFFHDSIGWDVTALSAMCGNMQFESFINPGKINAQSGAYGLTQWITNKTKMQNWCTNNGYSYSSGVGQTHYIDYERTHPGASQTDQWYGRGDFVGVTFNDFAFNTRNYDINTLTYCFWRCYERSAAYQSIRETYAAHYYQLFQGTPPSPGPSPGSIIQEWLLGQMFKKKRWWYQGGRRY